MDHYYSRGGEANATGRSDCVPPMKGCSPTARSRPIPARPLSCCASSCSGVPGLHGGLTNDLIASNLQHSRAEHLGAIWVGARLSEGYCLVAGQRVGYLVCHRTTANILIISGNFLLAPYVQGLAGRVVVIDDSKQRIVGVKRDECRGIAPLDGTFE